MKVKALVNFPVFIEKEFPPGLSNEEMWEGLKEEAREYLEDSEPVVAEIVDCES